MTNFYLFLPFPKCQVCTLSYVQSLACNNINSYIALSSWVVHLLFIFCRFRRLCVHNHRCTCRVWFGFDTSSFISSIPSEAVMSILYLWSPFPFTAPCHFLAGFVCVCESTAGEGWCLSFFFFLQLLCVCVCVCVKAAKEAPWSQWGAVEDCDLRDFSGHKSAPWF